MTAKKKPARKTKRATPARKTAVRAVKRAAKPARAPSAAYADFMVQAYAMENDARDRYTEFAEQMDMHNNPDVARLFRKLARIEGLHAETIVREMGWSKPPARTEAWMWRHSEAPESAAPGDLHYLMQPYQALELALESERRAVSFFSGMTHSTAPVEVKRIAREMAAEEREHVRLIREWLKKFPKPERGWDQDPDPPQQSD